MVADAAAFEEFADRHRQAVWDEVLASVRLRRRDPNWRPTRLMEGLAFQAQVGKLPNTVRRLYTTASRTGVMFLARVDVGGCNPLCQIQALPTSPVLRLLLKTRILAQQSPS